MLVNDSIDLQHNIAQHNVLREVKLKRLSHSHEKLLQKEFIKVCTKTDLASVRADRSQNKLF